VFQDFTTRSDSNGTETTLLKYANVAVVPHRPRSGIVNFPWCQQADTRHLRLSTELVETLPGALRLLELTGPPTHTATWTNNLAWDLNHCSFPGNTTRIPNDTKNHETAREATSNTHRLPLEKHLWAQPVLCTTRLLTQGPSQGYHKDALNIAVVVVLLTPRRFQRKTLSIKRWNFKSS